METLIIEFKRHPLQKVQVGAEESYTVYLFRRGVVTQRRLRASSLAVALSMGRQMLRSTQSDEFMLLKERT